MMKNRVVFPIAMAIMMAALLCMTINLTMNRNMRKELKFGILLFAIFNVVNLVVRDFIPEMPVLHFFLGGLAALAFAEIIIGILPEPFYLKLKQFKNNLRPFKK